MTVVALAVEKGGVGKSNLTESLAALRAGLKYRVAILDLDRQASTSKWGLRRKDTGGLPHVHIERGAGVDEVVVLEDFRRRLSDLKQAYQDVFIDVGGQDNGLFRETLLLADKVVAPLVPGPAEADTVIDLANTLRGMRQRPDVRVVLNMVSGMPNLLRVMQSTLDDHKDVLPTVGFTIGRRVAFPYASAAGKGVSELATRKEGFDPAAANDLRSLYLEIFGK
jgi:chromosome partitioning protein